MSDTHRQRARARIGDLVVRLKQIGAVDGREALVEEAESLGRAIDAFHMEAIRFRMFNVDRQLQRLPGGPPADAVAIFGEAREALEAAGFHTRSH